MSKEEEYPEDLIGGRDEDDIENGTMPSNYGIKEYLAEEEAYTKFILNLLKQQGNG
jgi:hypothetical protein